MELDTGPAEATRWHVLPSGSPRPLPAELTLTTSDWADLDDYHTVTVGGASPGETVRLYAGQALGAGTCNASGSVCMDITAPMRSLGTLAADGDGVAVFSVFFPSSRLTIGAEVALQAVVVRGALGADSIGSSPALVTVDGDGDGDSVLLSEDCDDVDASVHPAAPEVCEDGVDQDCDGADVSCFGGVIRDLGTADAKLVVGGHQEWAGYSVSGAGDIDGDGFGDLLVGAPHEASHGYCSGAAYVVLGPVTGTHELATADAKLLGEAESDCAGYSVSGAGDVDGDGFSDLLVGAPYEDSGGTSAGAASSSDPSPAPTTSPPRTPSSSEKPPPTPLATASRLPATSTETASTTSWSEPT